jgi:hypothetical protein
LARAQDSRVGRPLHGKPVEDRLHHRRGHMAAR